MAQLNFNAANVAPDTGVETVPAGWYNVAMDESSINPTKAGDGAYLKCRFNILDGQYAGRKLFTNFNIQNPNPTAQEIAYKQLSALCHAIGQLQVGGSEELHGKPVKVKVTVRKDSTGQYEDQNEIKQYKNINEQVQGGPPAAGGFGAPAGGFGAPAGGFGGQPQGGFPGQAPAGAPVQQPWANGGAVQQQQQFQPQPAQQFQPQQAPVQQQQFQAQQPVQQQQQFQPAAAPAGAPAQGGWQQPTNQQPWAAAPAGAPMQGQPQPGQPAQQFVQQQPAPAPQHAPAGQVDPATAQMMAQHQASSPPWAQQQVQQPGQ